MSQRNSTKMHAGTRFAVHAASTQGGGDLELCAPEPRVNGNLLCLQSAAQARAAKLIELVVHQLMQDDVTFIRRARIDDSKGHAVGDPGGAVESGGERAVHDNAHAVGQLPQYPQLLGLEKVRQRLLRRVPEDPRSTRPFGFRRVLWGGRPRREAWEAPALYHSALPPLRSLQPGGAAARRLRWTKDLVVSATLSPRTPTLSSQPSSLPNLLLFCALDLLPL